MYATVCRHAGVAATSDDRALAGRALANHLGALPGFIAYVLLEQLDGACIGVSIFEDEGSQVAADRLAEAWLAAHTGAPRAVSPDIITGEVIVQKGL
ncbi:MAG: hypothetical protein ACTHMU_10390 [Thermomicrobiales bacterium]